MTFDYTRTCVCPYPLQQTLIALVPKPRHRVEFHVNGPGYPPGGGDVVQWVYDRERPLEPTVGTEFSVPLS